MPMDPEKLKKFRQGLDRSSTFGLGGTPYEDEKKKLDEEEAKKKKKKASEELSGVSKASADLGADY
jgi:hypothetical protein